MTARIFPLFLLLHLLLWTLIPTLVSPNASLDVIEGYAWGHEWLLGTYKHPPLQAWLLEIFALATGRASFVPFLLSQLCILTAFWAVWRLGKRITSENTAFLGVLLLEGIAYFHFTTPEFNPNVLQLPFWALACLSFHRALREGRWWDWVLLGSWGALGFWSKYSILILLAAFGLFLLIDAGARKNWRGKGPWLAALSFLLLTFPHLHWLVQNDFLPFAYVQERMEDKYSLLLRLLDVSRFVGAQALVLLGACLLFFLAAGKQGWKNKSKFPVSEDRRFLTFVVWVPFALVLVFLVASGGRSRDMWGSYLWSYFGLWLALGLPDGFVIPRRFWIGFLTLFFVLPLAYGTVAFLGPYVAKRAPRIIFPGQELSERLTQAWQSRFEVSPAFVVGDTWLAGNVAFYAPKTTTRARPQVFIEANPLFSPWIDLKLLEKKGALLVWCQGRCEKKEGLDRMPSYLAEKFPEAEIQKPFEAVRETSAKVLPAFVGWAILSPKE